MTPDQRKDARALVKACRDLASENAALERQRAEYRAQEHAANEAAIQKLHFSNPEQLPDVFRLWARLAADLRATLIQRYSDGILSIASRDRDSTALYFDTSYRNILSRNRCLFAGPYLKLQDRKSFPLLDLRHSDPDRGSLSYVYKHAPCDVTAWRQALSSLSDWLGGNWEITHTTIDSITLDRRTPLPQIMPFDRTCMLRRAALFVGIDVTTREPAYIPFSELSSGTLIPGVAGTGKSNALHILLRSLFANIDLFTAVYLVDGKDGVAFNRYRSIHPKVHVLWEDADLWALTPRLVADMRTRNGRQIDAGTDNATRDFVAIVIDEMSTYTPKPSSNDKDLNKRHGAFIDELATLARRGRSVGYRFFFTVQEPTEAQIPTSVRNNCQTTIGFRLAIDQHATALYGQLETLPADPRKLTRGHALVKEGQTGTLRLVKFPVMPMSATST